MREIKFRVWNKKKKQMVDLKQKVDPVFLKMFNAAQQAHPNSFKKFDITKDRQDQLQEMIPHRKEVFALVFGVFEFANINPVSNHCKTMEQLLLAFVMWELHAKRWLTSEQKWVTVN